MLKNSRTLAAGIAIPLMRSNEERLPSNSHPSRLWALMEAEHARLDELLAEAAASGNVQAYAEFRHGLLRHIGIEEKILLPAARRCRGGQPLPLAERLKLDHGALATLVMLPPAAATYRVLRAILDVHNPLEDSSGGVYEQCESAVGLELGELLKRCEAAPPVPVSPWADSPKIVAAARRVLLRAGYADTLLNYCENRLK